jgi:alkaline phosphatase D
MKRSLLAGALASCLCLSSCLLPHRYTGKVRQKIRAEEITSIAFGSCSNQNKPQPVLEAVVKRKPDLFVYLGDNIYSNTDVMAVMRWKYRKLLLKREFRQLVDSVPVIAVWDDHDYGFNDSGAEFKKKEGAKRVFLRFWNEPAGSQRRKHKGIYTSVLYGKEGRRVHLILLDTRTFRSGVLEKDNKYIPRPDTNATMLGSEQWAWLREKLKVPAQVTVIATSTQFAVEYNTFETWANLPSEQQRMLRLIKESGVKGLVFISGDLHYSELSKISAEGHYDLYDLTSSGITEVADGVEKNSNRVGEPFLGQNYGMLEFEWTESPVIHFRVFDKDNAVRLHKAVKLEELR